MNGRKRANDINSFNNDDLSKKYVVMGCMHISETANKTQLSDPGPLGPPVSLGFFCRREVSQW